jgi:hypothetical protein
MKAELYQQMINAVASRRSVLKGAAGAAALGVAGASARGRRGAGQRPGPDPGDPWRRDAAAHR